MADGLKQYKKELGRLLPCPRKTRRQLVARLDAYRDSEMADNPSPTYEQLVSGFGPPEEMAQTLSMELTPQDRAAYRRNRLAYRAAAVALAAALLVFTVYIWILKTTPIEVIEKTVIITESDTTEEVEDIK